MGADKFLPFTLLLLAGCVAEPKEKPGNSAEMEARASDLARAESQPTALPAPAPAPPSSERQPDDLAPCPGINPDIRRPAGSNCLGITPDQCGADKVMVHIGESATPTLRRKVETVATENIRWYRTGDALIENLDPSRLNMELDAKDLIISINCF